MPTPYDAPYKVEQRRLRAAAKNRTLAQVSYKQHKNIKDKPVAIHAPNVYKYR
jgi:hypothetical protein